MHPLMMQLVQMQKLLQMQRLLQMTQLTLVRRKGMKQGMLQELMMKELVMQELMMQELMMRLERMLGKERMRPLVQLELRMMLTLKQVEVEVIL